eukprot:11695144-Karenia_brevis.AAC.1
MALYRSKVDQLNHEMILHIPKMALHSAGYGPAPRWSTIAPRLFTMYQDGPTLPRDNPTKLQEMPRLAQH